MNLNFRLSFVLLLLTVTSGVWAQQATISQVVPASAPSRPAHFNWTFTSANGQPAITGQFACGSYWVAPAAGDNGVTFVSLKGLAGQNDLLSCDADPWTEKHGLLGSEKTYGNYDAQRNLLPKLPLTYRPAADSCVSLVAAMQRNEAETSNGGTRAIVGNVADAYCVVTVLAKAPADGGRNMIRPNITGASKEMLTWDDFDLTRLPKHDFLTGKSAEQWQGTALRWRHSTEIFGMATEVEVPRRGLQFQKFSEGGRAFRSHLLIHDYGSGMARAFNDDVLAMFAADRDLEAVKPALAAMLSFGLDLYHARYNIGENARKRWSCGAGQSPGQFVPPVLLAALQRDQTKAHRLRMTAITNHGDDRGEVGPQEMRQFKRGVTGVLLWGDGHPIQRPENKMVEADWRYWADFTSSKCYDTYQGNDANPNRGKKTAADPYGYIDGPANRPGSSYMGVALGPARSFAAIMILMPEFRSIVNTDAPIEYVDRVTRHGLWTSPDPVAPPAKGDQETARLWWSVQGAEQFGKTWGVRQDDVRFAIEDGTGRFKSLHGRALGGGYDSARAKNNWDRIIAMYDGPKFEENAVNLDTTVAPEIRFATGENSRVYLFGFTPDAVIHYTLDGSDPTTNSPIYQGEPLTVDADTLVQAIALHPDKKPSTIRSGKLPAVLR